MTKLGIIEDTRQKKGKHDVKNAYWYIMGIPVERHPLPIGDYILMTDKVTELLARKEKRGVPLKEKDFAGTFKASVDSKYGVQELEKDICSGDHDRFKDECILAQNSGVKLFVLVENDDGIQTVRDLYKWVNPRSLWRRNGKPMYPNATAGVTLMKCCLTMEKKYGVEFHFCRPDQAAVRVVELLRGEEYGKTTV